MRQLFMCVLSLSLSGALTGLVLLLIRPLTGKYFSKKWNYYIWLLLIIRLLLPVHFEMPGLVQGGDTLLAEMEGGQKEIALPGLSVPEKEMGAAQLEGAGEELNSPAMSDSETSAKHYAWQVSDIPLRLPDPVTVLAVIWLVGACLCFIIKITNYMRFNRCIQKGSKEISDGQTLLLREDLCERLHIKRQPILLESPSVSGPITIGLFKPMVILPANDSADGDVYNRQTLIIHHELVHIKRRDLWYKWLYQVLLCIHWFNPVLYLVAGKLNRDCELSCDEEVLKILTSDGRKAYGNLLISMAERNLFVQKNVFSTTLLERKEDLKERLGGILQYKKQKAGRIVISLSMAFGLLFISACGSVQAAPDAMPIQVSVEKTGEDTKDAPVLEGGAYVSDEDGFSWVSFWDSFTEKLFDYDVDDFLQNRMIVNKSGKAWKAYDDDELLAGKDISGQWSAFHYAGGGNSVNCSGLMLNGSDSVRIINAEKETTLKVDSAFELIEGRFKIIYVSPEGHVDVLNETGESSSAAITLKKGRNAKWWGRAPS